MDTKPQELSNPFVVPAEISRISGGKTAEPAGNTIPVINPATEGTISTLYEDDGASVAEAVRAARKAFDEGDWPRLDLKSRKKILRDIQAAIAEHAEELAYLECLDTGSPLWDIKGRKISRVGENFAFFSEVASTAAGETFQQNNSILTFVTRDPVGVAAILAPWNAPMSLATMQIAPCIAFGNTCVVKPSEHTPLSLYRLVQIMHEAGLPPGVVNLVNGRGPVTGAALVADPGVDMVKFIGGTATARSILTAASSSFKKVGLELGGKSANIIFEDADFDDAVTGALLSIYTNNGQQCLAGSRILVQRSISKDFIEQFVSRAARIRLGDPLDPKTEMGPLAFKDHYERVAGYVETAQAEGAELLTGGKKAPGFERGYFFQPTAVLAPNNGLAVCQEEIFGPFATIIEFDDLDDAIAIANDTDFGLVGYAWSRDVRKLMQVSKRLKTGTVWLNMPSTRELRAPFGGVKNSGIGRDGLAASTDFYTQVKTTSVPWDRVDLRQIGMG